jgi:hypothetical protein
MWTFPNRFLAKNLYAYFVSLTRAVTTDINSKILETVGLVLETASGTRRHPQPQENKGALLGPSLTGIECQCRSFFPEVSMLLVLLVWLSVIHS